MLGHYAASRCGHNTHPIGENLAMNLKKIKNKEKEKFEVLEKVTDLSLAALLGPRFKELGFCNQCYAQIGV